ncbi:hypothetical protein AVEN_215420-1, partial [Araneus ventricosus]
FRDGIGVHHPSERARWFLLCRLSKEYISSEYYVDIDQFDSFHDKFSGISAVLQDSRSEKERPKEKRFIQAECIRSRKPRSEKLSAPSKEPKDTENSQTKEKAEKKKKPALLKIHM